MKNTMQIVNDQFKTYRQKRRLRGAINRAYAAFSQQYPKWANSLFDMYFLQHQAASTFNLQHPPEAEALTEVYLKMIDDHKTVQSYQRTAVLPIANAFIQLMTTELQA